MKFIRKSTMLVLAIGMLLVACNPDNVAPTESGNGNPSLAGAANDPHPFLDTICQTADTMFLVREDDGSEVVNKCYGMPGQPGAPRACRVDEQVKWGYLEMVEGYFADTGYIDCNFTMAPGWYCDQNNWEFSIASAFTFDNNGIPIVTNDWSSNIVRPLASRWQLRVKTTVLPDPCYAVALRVGALKLNIFGATVAGSQTTLWGKNRNWNVPSHPANSVSPWLQSFCPLRCLDTPPPPPAPDTVRICEVVYTGLTCTGNNLGSTVLHPTATETGVITYAWSNGATTQDLTVSPTTTTNYSVVISVDGVPTHVVIFTVNVIDVACTITQGGGGGNGGGGNGGGGNGGGNGGSGSGSGSGNGGSGSGNGGSGSGNGGGGNCGNGGSGSGNGSGNGGSGSGSGNGGSGSGNGGNGNSVCGNADQVTGCSAATNSSRVLGAPNGQGAMFTNTGNSITVKLKHTLPAGTQYAITWKKSGSGTASMRVFESQSNGSYAPNGAAFTTTSTNYVTKTLTTTAATRYLRLESTSSTDFYVDAVTYCYTPVLPTIPGVKVCHVPPGNPGGATTICVSYSQLAQHVTGVCPTTNGGGGNSGNGGSGSGSGSGGSGSGHGWGGSGSGSGNGGSGSGSGGGNGHGCGGHTNNCNGHHQGGNCNNGHSGSGSGGSGSGHGSGQGSGSGGGNGSGSNANGHGSHHGGGCQGNQGGGHPGDMIGACNSNPCL